MSEDTKAQIAELAEAGGVTAEDIERFAEAVAKLGAEPEGPITYTNRAARRARARAERRRA